MPVRAGRPQVGEDVELLAQTEKPLLGSHGLPLEAGEADRGKEHRRGLPACGQGLVGERRALGHDRVAAEGVLRVGDPESVEHPHRLGRDLGADPVARQHHDVHVAVPPGTSPPCGEVPDASRRS